MELLSSVLERKIDAVFSNIRVMADDDIALELGVKFYKQVNKYIETKYRKIYGKTLTDVLKEQVYDAFVNFLEYDMGYCRTRTLIKKPN